MTAAYIVLERDPNEHSANNRIGRIENDMSTTTTTPETPKAPPLEKQTSAGNYFVSNYPPFSFWKPEFVPEVLAAMERPPSTLNTQLSTHPLGLYVHIPFCRKRCHF